MKEKCKTCEIIEFWKTHPSQPEFEDKLFAKISIYTWRKGERKIKGNQKSSITTRAYNLKYCPTCGRKLGDKENE